MLVSVVYRVAPDDCAAFLDAMDDVARSRRRTGALTWGLFQDGNEPGRFIENYLVGSRGEHLAQHHSRLTATDRASVGPTVPRPERAASRPAALPTGVVGGAGGRLSGRGPVGGRR